MVISTSIFLLDMTNISIMKRYILEASFVNIVAVFQNRIVLRRYEHPRYTNQF